MTQSAEFLFAADNSKPACISNSSRNVKGIFGKRIEIRGVDIIYICFGAWFSNCGTLTATGTPTIVAITYICYGAWFSNCGTLTATGTPTTVAITYICYGAWFSNCGTLTETGTPTTVY
jgi:hypothetical protein